MEGFPGSIAYVGPQIVTKSKESNHLRCRNLTDKDGVPGGGYVHGVGLSIVWQDGPRGMVGEQLNPPNGAFVEDALQAAAQRLFFFQQSQFSHPDNQEAIDHIQAALDALARRSEARRARGVLGTKQV